MSQPDPLPRTAALVPGGRLLMLGMLRSLVLCTLLLACGAEGSNDSQTDAPSLDSSTPQAASGTGQPVPEKTVPEETVPDETVAQPPTTGPVASSTTSLSTASSADSSTASSADSTTTVGGEAMGAETTSVPFDGALGAAVDAPAQTVLLRFESKIAGLSSEQLANEVLTVLNDERGWPRAGFRFDADDASPFRVVLAEGSEVDALCLPLQTYGTVSCQNGPVVALNADRWRGAVEHWDAAVSDYRGYLINHEVGHLLGQRHPKPRCPVAGRPAGVMEQQTAGLLGCQGNAWPRDWEIALAKKRPVVYAPLPDWGPDPVPANGES